MKLSAIIVTYRSTQEVATCLKSLMAGIRKPDEVIIVNNGPKEDKLELLKDESANIAILNSENNIGFGAAVNLGSKHAHGDLLMVLNPDTQFSKQTIEVLLQRMENNFQINILGPRVINIEGQLQNSARSYPTPKTYFFNRNSLLSKFFPNNVFTREYLDHAVSSRELCNVDWVSGCCFIVRKDSFDSIGGFDHDYFLFMEDTDLCKRMNEKYPCSVFYDPEPSIIHETGISDRNMDSQIELHRYESIYKYIDKHFVSYNTALYWLMKRVARVKIWMLMRTINKS